MPLAAEREIKTKGEHSLSPYLVSSLIADLTFLFFHSLSTHLNALLADLREAAAIQREAYQMRLAGQASRGELAAGVRQY
jgi:hypothetical protein